MGTHIYIVSLSSVLKSLWIKASAKCPECKCTVDSFGKGCNGKTIETHVVKEQLGGVWSVTTHRSGWRHRASQLQLFLLLPLSPTDGEVAVPPKAAQPLWLIHSLFISVEPGRDPVWTGRGKYFLRRSYSSRRSTLNLRCLAGNPFVRCSSQQRVQSSRLNLSSSPALASHL